MDFGTIKTDMRINIYNLKQHNRFVANHEQAMVFVFLRSTQPFAATLGEFQTDFSSICLFLIQLCKSSPLASVDWQQGSKRGLACLGNYHVPRLFDDP